MARETFPEMLEREDGPDTIWMDGEFLDWEDAEVHVLSHAIHYGTGVFEGVRCYETERGPAIFRWEEHLERLFQSGRPYGIEIPHSREELTVATAELIRRQDFDSCYVRPVVFYGYGRLGIGPGDNPIRAAIAAWPWGPYLGEGALERGIDVAVSSWRRLSDAQVPIASKATGAYVNSVLASLEASERGYDEAILLNDSGAVAEGPGENLFLVRNGDLHTPGLGENVLPGITRESVVELARDLGYVVRDDARIGRGELYTADELFFAGTAAEVTPIRRVDGVAVGDGTRGPITGEIQDRFFEVVRGGGGGEAYDDWFTFVDAVAATAP